ncbi:amidase signature domain-containing protein [Dipodascopsis tothii]|uniref:amidase signature domain-containing protein n=1 Tax=Dipodascopsis tothii TaxID=44089 RepID=UPI0034CEEFE1
MTSWEEKAAAKRAALAAAIPAELQFSAEQLPGPDRLDVSKVPAELLPAEVVAITELTASELVAAIAARKYTSVEVTTAFIKRAVLAHQLLNVFTEFFPAMALKRAAELDAILAETGKPVGPLHGLPMTLKDQFRVKGVETSMGYVAWIGTPEAENSTMVDLLLEAGAVFFVKTNIPTSLMCPETDNVIYGKTFNAYNRTLSPGGSSGGEGALVSMKGAPLGIGTDIGGSIRIPSSASGVYGLRPSHGRFPYLKVANSLPYNEVVPSVAGPLANSVADLTLFTQAVLAGKPWTYDPRVVPLPFAPYELPARPLVFAVEFSDGLVTPHPPVLRGLRLAADALRAAGHEVFEIKPFDPATGNDVLLRSWTLDGGEEINSVLDASGEPGIPEIKPFINGYKALNMMELFEFNKDKLEYKTAFLEYMRDLRSPSGKPIDAWLRPVMPSACVPAGKFKYRYLGYTGLLNVLDYPCVVVPTIKCDPAVDVPAPAPADDADELEKLTHADYDPEVYKNGPVGMQVIGGRLEEERTLAVAAVVDAAIKAALA